MPVIKTNPLATEPHKFTNAGPGPSRLVCIHANPTVVGEWLQ